MAEALKFSLFADFHYKKEMYAVTYDDLAKILKKAEKEHEELYGDKSDGNKDSKKNEKENTSPVHGTVADSFEDVFSLNILTSGKVGDGPGNPQDPVIGTGTQPEFFNSMAQ